MIDKIGNIIKNIQFSDEEKRRLRSQILNTETLQHKILVEKTPLIQSPDFWKIAVKVFRVTGFRSKVEVLRPIILSKVFSNFRQESKSSESEFSWKLYKQCVIEYVGDELRNLNELLLNEEFEESKDNLTKNIFSIIVKHASLYEVSNDDIRQLYELWGFPRVDNFDQILISQNISNDILQKIIKTYDGKINEIKLQINDITGIVKKDKSIINALSDIDDLKKNNKLLQQTLTSALKKHSDELLTTQISPINKKYNVILELVKGIESNCIAMSEEFKRTSDKIVNLESIYYSSQAEFQKHINELNDKFSIVESKFKHHADHLVTSDTSCSGHETTLSNIVPEMITNWENLGYENASVGGVILLLTLLKSGNLFLLDNAQSMSLLIDMIPGVAIERITASPHWTTLDDWLEGIKFIESDTNKYKILAILDFDVGIQQTYLVPFLIGWLNSRASNCTKIFLIPSAPDSKQIYERIFEIAITWPLGDFTVSSMAEMADVINTSLVGFDCNAKLLPEYIFADRYCNLNYRKDLIKISRREDMSNYLISNFINIVKYLDEISIGSMSINLSAHLTYIPWLKATQGPIAAREAEENFINISRNEND